MNLSERGWHVSWRNRARLSNVRQRLRNTSLAKSCVFVFYRVETVLMVVCEGRPREDERL